MSHWQLADLPWHALDRAAVEPALLAAVKTAALVEANSVDYVRYLHSVFGDDADFKAAADVWGQEEAQHGAALGRWAGLVDPGFDFADALARFRAGYQLPVDADQSVRGSLAGELLARCVVESGTCSYYSAMRDSSREPVLKAICHRIAQDEARHFRLFHSHLQRYVARRPIGLWARIKVALGRVVETDDDELAYAYFSANEGQRADAVYDRARCAAAYQRVAMALYGRPHVRALVTMIAQAIGVRTSNVVVQWAGRFGWWWMQRAAGR